MYYQNIIIKCQVFNVYQEFQVHVTISPRDQFLMSVNFRFGFQLEILFTFAWKYRLYIDVEEDDIVHKLI